MRGCLLVRGVLLLLLVGCTDVETFDEGVAAQVFQIRVNIEEDDAEECVPAPGEVEVYSSDLEFFYDDYRLCDQQLGLRFRTVQIPRGARILAAHLQFTAGASSTVETAIAIRGDAADNSAGFTDAPGNVSGRPSTQARVDWDVPVWVAGDAGEAQRTPDLRVIVQEIIDRPGWVESGALTLVASGSGQRIAQSFGGDPEGAPLLIIEWLP